METLNSICIELNGRVNLGACVLLWFCPQSEPSASHPFHSWEKPSHFHRTMLRLTERAIQWSICRHTHQISFHSTAQTLNGSIMKSGACCRTTLFKLYQSTVPWSTMSTTLGSVLSKSSITESPSELLDSGVFDCVHACVRENGGDIEHTCRLVSNL